MNYKIIFTVGATLLVADITMADTMASAAQNDQSFGPAHDHVHGSQAGGFMGLGVFYSSSDYEGGDDSEIFIAPLFHYDWASGQYVSVIGASEAEKAVRVKGNLITKEKSSIWEFGPLLQYRFGRNGIVNNKVDSLEGGDTAIELGAFAGLSADPWSATLSIARDVSSVHDGTLAYLSSSYDMQISNKFSIEMSANLTWADDSYMRSAFSVSRADSINLALPEYKANGGFKDAGFAVTGHYQFNQKWGVLGSISYTRMVGDAKDSPVVKDLGNENQLGTMVAATYSF